ncbi:hypothetical protein JTE90_024059 [Oedothorax gibbosus]|uniref:Uncharacterized protein n=1 Tax=Oedothorax gibbosus TaxID=931172 RepID=A0AAV6TW52_9ARAC|nr:hypothetical protein JTE90_024059 [Oedothorax gibbosus]
MCSYIESLFKVPLDQTFHRFLDNSTTMEALLFVLLAACCFAPALSYLEDPPTDVEEMKAIQERLALLEGIEKMMLSEETREDECLAEGRGCSFGSGPKCCGLRMRCIIWDHYTPQRGGPAKWHSVCREYKAGVALDDIGKFFGKLG